MTIGAKPATLSDADVRAILERELTGDFDQIAGGTGVRTDLAIGDEIEAQLFGSQVLGVLESLSAGGRAVISAFLLGGEIRAELSASAISRRSGI